MFSRGCRASDSIRPLHDDEDTGLLRQEKINASNRKSATTALYEHQARFHSNLKFLVTNTHSYAHTSAQVQVPAPTQARCLHAQVVQPYDLIHACVLKGYRY